MCAEYPSQMTQHFSSYYILLRPIVNKYLQITKVYGTENEYWCNDVLLSFGSENLLMPNLNWTPILKSYNSSMQYYNPVHKNTLLNNHMFRLGIFLLIIVKTDIYYVSLETCNYWVVNFKQKPFHSYVSYVLLRWWFMEIYFKNKLSASLVFCPQMNFVFMYQFFQNSILTIVLFFVFSDTRKARTNGSSRSCDSNSCTCIVKEIN